MALNAPIHQRDQAYRRAFRVPNSESDTDLRPVLPSLKSVDSYLAGTGEPSQNDTGSDYQYLLEAPDKDIQAARWKPGWARFPGLAILSLLGVCASTIASTFILSSSHRQPLNDWGYGIPPSVYLAIASIIANALSAYALANGLVISFWRTALCGRTLAELNQNWLCGQSLEHALLRGFRAGGRIPALACILSIIALLRGPLYQRASAVQSDVSYNTSGNASVAIAQRLPEGYTGIARDARAAIMQIARLTPDFAQIMQEYSVRSNITVQHGDCGDTCTTSIKGFGFKTVCVINDFIQYIESTPPFDQEVFVTSTTLYPIADDISTSKYWDDAGILFNATYRIPLLPEDNTANVSLRRTRLRSHICNVTGGTVRYSVQLSSQSATLSANRSDDQFLEDIELRGPGTWGYDSTIGGFEYAASYLFTSNAIFHYSGAISSTTFTGSLANEMVQSGSIGIGDFLFQDPMAIMLDAIREIAFRTSVHAAKNANITNLTNAQQEIEYHGSAKHSIYVTDFRYMAAAVAVSMFSLFAVGLTLWGWWELGRHVSLSPLEIAKAFDAPLLMYAGSNLDLSDNKKLGLVGITPVQYGEGLTEDDVRMRDGSGGKTEVQRRRLVMGIPGGVRRPIAGATYGI